MKHYRILYHHRTQALDGQRVHIREIQQALRGLGHEVIEVAPLAGTESAGERITPSLQRRLLSAIAEHTPAGMYEVVELAYNLSAYRRLAKTIRSTKPDFIYERHAVNTVAGAWVARRFGIPLFLEVNSPLADEKKALGKLMFYRTARHLERYAISNATRTLAVTGVLKRMLLASTGVAESRVRVIQNGVDVQRFEAAAAQRHAVRQRWGVDSDVVIGAVGFFREWHGIDGAIRAVRRMRELKIAARLVLVGDGPVVPALRDLTRALALEDRITFLGSVPHQEVPGLVAATDVMLIPRAVEYASPLKLFEYMASQKAIIAPRQPNLEEILSDGVDVLFFTPEVQSELEAALLRLVQDERLRHDLGHAARRTIDRKNLTWAGNAARIVQAFEEVRGERVTAGVLASSSV
jgi:glycosyltransferase involved in cell wall biosynthesis